MNTSTNMTEATDPVQRVVVFFTTITPESISRLDTMYAPNAYFKDPFNEVHGLSAIQDIFSHMFVALDNPQFVVHESVVQGDRCFLTWDFQFRFKRFDTLTTQVVRGTSHLRFDDAGKVTYHRDYWDVAEELYEKLPLLGGFMRWLKKRANS